MEGGGTGKCTVSWATLNGECTHVWGVTWEGERMEFLLLKDCELPEGRLCLISLHILSS